MLNKLIILCFLFGLFSLGYAQTNDNNNDTVSQIDLDVQKGCTKSKSLVVTTPIIYKAFQQKRPSRPLNISESELLKQTTNAMQDNSDKEVYIRVENTDYFVKFCSSKVTRMDIEKAIKQAIVKQKRQNKTQRAVITLDITLTEGSWDICQPDSMLMQSRIGKYAIVHRIVHGSNAKNVVKNNEKKKIIPSKER